MTTLLQAFVCGGHLEFKDGNPFNIGDDDFNFLGQPDSDFVIAHPLQRQTIPRLCKNRISITTPLIGSE
jgi:hypothetical protein